jgi:hypothetical protein
MAVVTSVTSGTVLNSSVFKLRYIFGRFYTEKKERLMWGVCLFVSGLVSATNTFATSSRNSIHQHYTQICRISVRFLKIR